MAGGRVRVNTAVFSNDYRDLQVQSFLRPGVIDVSNAGSATIRGIEVEGAATAGRGVQLEGYVSWLDAIYDSYLFKGPGSETFDAAGNRLNNAPEWSGSGSAVYEIGTGQCGDGLRAGDGVVAEPGVLHASQRRHRDPAAYGLVHLRAGFDQKPATGR